MISLDIMVDLGKQLRDAIRRSGLTRRQISKRSGVAYSAVHGFVGGKQTLTLESASKIADVVGIEFRPRRAKRPGRSKS